jgi:hypothetical protein
MYNIKPSCYRKPIIVQYLLRECEGNILWPGNYFITVIKELLFWSTPLEEQVGTTTRLSRFAMGKVERFFLYKTDMKFSVF